MNWMQNVTANKVAAVPRRSPCLPFRCPAHSYHVTVCPPPLALQIDTPLCVPFADVFALSSRAHVARAQAYMVLPGNHERDCHSDDCVNDLTLQRTFMNFTAYNARFRMPGPESGACSGNPCQKTQPAPHHPLQL
jgi:hypothetical protein